MMTYWIHDGKLCMHYGKLCMRDGMLDAIDMLETLCTLNLTQFTPHTHPPPPVPPFLLTQNLRTLLEVTS